MSRQMKIPAADIRLDAEFSQYGFDSISLTALATSLKQQWRLNLAPTIFSSMPRSAVSPLTWSASTAAC
ncbi:acyl carrier protein [Ralstonia syzygii subsp. celebesensis]